MLLMAIMSRLLAANADTWAGIHEGSHFRQQLDLGEVKHKHA